MIKLDSFQKKAISSINQNLDVLVVAPTGSGKTLIAEHAIKKYLLEKNKILYTTPIKALSNQKYSDFKNDYGDSVGILTGDRNINKNAPILVLTTEILRNMIYSKDQNLNDVGVVVLDEVHYLGDRERGRVWEELIIHLPLGIKIIYLSATIANAIDFQEWLVSLRGPTDLIITENRPVPLTSNLITANKNNEKIVNIFSMNSSHYLADNKLLTNLNKFYKVHYRKNFIKPSFEVMAKYLMDNKSTPSIFFIFSREKTETIARRLANVSIKKENLSELYNLISPVFNNLNSREKELVNYDELLWMWTRGVSYHHAGMIPLIKETIELLFLKGYIDILLATETLSLGINMPAKSVVISSLHKYDGFSTRPINQNEYMQLTGRAGRRGIDKAGQAYLFFDKTVNADWYPNIFNIKSNNLNSQFSLSLSSIVGLTHLYNKEKAIDTLQKSFWSYQNNYDIGDLIDDYEGKYNFLEKTNFIYGDSSTELGTVLLEVNRDNFIPGILLMNNYPKSDLLLEDALGLICQGMRWGNYVKNIPKSLNSFSEALSREILLCNKIMGKFDSKEYFYENYSAFEPLFDFINNSNINKTMDLFDISAGDFIKDAKEALEIASKFSDVYKLNIFDMIIEKLDIGLINKTIYE